VVVGLRPGSASVDAVEAEVLPWRPPVEAVASADLVMFLTPDETHGALYETVEASLRPSAAIGFSHGLAIHFGFISPRADLDVFLLAPKGPGTALRSLYEQGAGMVALWAVGQDATGGAGALALAYGQAIGCARAGLIASSFVEECEADLFNEQAVVWGAVPEILIAGFETLTAAGVSEEVAFLECVGELKLLAELIEARGIAGMREAISTTAELGAAIGGPRLVGSAVRQAMADALAEIRAGSFADALRAEAASGYPKLKEARVAARAHPTEKVFQRLRALGAEG
jgi:ketol-acid reductoisomerase